MSQIKRYRGNEQKIEIIQYYENVKDKYETMNKFEISKNYLNRVLNSKDKILQSTCLKPAKFAFKESDDIPELESVLLLWIKIQKENSSLFNFKDFSKKVSMINDEMNTGIKVIKNTWINKFIKNNDLMFLTDISSTELNKILPIKANVAEIAGLMKVDKNQIYTITEFSIFYKKPRLEHFECGGTPSIFDKSLQERLTLLPCTNGDGTNKLPLFVIYNPKNKENVEKLGLDTHNIIGRLSDNGSLTYDIFKDWFYNKFVPAVREYSSNNEITPTALLLINHSIYNFRDGFYFGTKDGLIRTICAPSDYGYIFQPMNQGIMYKLKKNYKIYSLSKFSPENINMGYLHDIDISQAFKWLSDSWNDISVPVIKNSFNNLFAAADATYNLFDGILDNNIELEYLIKELCPNNHLLLNDWVYEKFLNKFEDLEIIRLATNGKFPKINIPLFPSDIIENGSKMQHSIFKPGELSIKDTLFNSTDKYKLKGVDTVDTTEEHLSALRNVKKLLEYTQKNEYSTDILNVLKRIKSQILEDIDNTI